MSAIYDCIIVGSGISGLIAARTLLKNGISDLAILEGRNRIGGRINFKKSGDSVVDIGAHFIHGQDGNKMFEFAKERNLIVREDEHFSKGDLFFTPNGVKMPTVPAQQFANQCNDIAKELLNYKGVTDPVSSMADMLHDMKSQLNFSNDSLTFNEKVALYNLRFQMECTDMGSSFPEKVSLKGFREAEDCYGPYYNYLKNGYSSVVTELAKDIPCDKVKLNTTVVNIDWSNDSLCKVTTSEGVFFGKFVISTIPLGCLKQNAASLFTPNLPQTKTDVISRLGFGNNSRILLRFSRRWWPCDVDSMYVVWSDEDRSNQVAFDCQKKELYKREADMYWFSYLYGFKSDPSCGPDGPFLVARLPGDWSDIIEGLPDDEIKRVCWRILKSALGSFYKDIEEPKEVLRWNWKSDPFSVGTYSHVQTGESIQDFDVLSRPLPSEKAPRLLFAGEATVSLYNATVHGAWTSGEREAKRVLEHSGK